jgi:hypothetical protein
MTDPTTPRGPPGQAERLPRAKTRVPEPPET